MRTGLTSSDVQSRRVQYGENRLPQPTGMSAGRILLAQVKSPLIYIICIAAAISLLLGERGDFFIIMLVVVTDVVLGFIQDYRAQKTYVSLRSVLKPRATVIRDGTRLDVDVWELVPGDLVVLAAGDRVPADGDLLEASKLALDEAVLTGESESVTKHEKDTVFMGATVLTGRGLMCVAATGSGTELGRIATSMARTEEALTPLQIRLSRFSGLLTKVVLATTLLILVVGLLAGYELFSMLRTAIVLSIAAIPEGLIIAVTVILVLGMRNVLRRQGLVKHLLAVETLGSVTTICTDKTGTLTEGRMRVTEVLLFDTEMALRTMVFCNDLEGPVDTALWEYAERHMATDPQVVVDGAPRVAEELFTSDTKYMIAGVTTDAATHQPQFFLKGAPEIVMRMCATDVGTADLATDAIEGWADAGLRCLALATRNGGHIDEYSGYTLLGLLALKDPVRDGVVDAIRSARSAGIRILMVTGDYQRTAESVARTIGIPDQTALDGAALQQLDDAALKNAVRTVGIYARIRPRDKVRIVEALKSNGAVIAMVGDGVNDAPALTHADIGVVVGTATDVAKETADLILLDNNFRTIVSAVEEGRVVFDNIRKVVAYVLSNSFAEVLTVFLAMVIGWPTPLLVAQILWIHLICDGPQDIVLGFEPREAGIMERPPRPLTESVLDRFGLGMIAVISGLSAAFGLSVFGFFHLVQQDDIRGRSIVFAMFALSSVLYIPAYRSLRSPLRRMNPMTANKPLLAAMFGGVVMGLLPFLVAPLGSLLGVAPLSLGEWALVLGFSLFLLATVEAAKALQTASCSSPYPRNVSSDLGRRR